MDWEKYRYADGSLNLFAAYRDYWGEPPSMAASGFWNDASAIHPIKSRQIAAIMLALMKEKN